MRVILLATLLSLGVAGSGFAASMTEIGGGFGYVPAGDGTCKILVDAKSGLPVLRRSKRDPSRALGIGTKATCPTTYEGYKVTRLQGGVVNGYIFSATAESGRRVHIYRRAGSRFTVRLGPTPKKD